MLRVWQDFILTRLGHFQASSKSVGMGSSFRFVIKSSSSDALLKSPKRLLLVLLSIGDTYFSGSASFASSITLT